jgi:hypothetical protein
MVSFQHQFHFPSVFTVFFSGNLTFKHHSTIHMLETPKINNILTENLMTLTTNQTINSDFFIQKFFTSNLTTHGLLNGAINFKEVVVEIGKENFIESTVKFNEFTQSIL